MRLGTCIAVELLVGAVTLVTVGAGTSLAVASLGSPIARPLAVRAPLPLPLPLPLPDPTPVVVPPAAVAPTPVGPAWGDDAAALAPLLTGHVVKVKFNKGGSSLSLRIDFDNGARAAFKPEQTAPQSDPRRELAAYRLDRLLGLDRVPPAVGRSFPLDELVAAVAPADAWKAARITSEGIVKKGQLRGTLSWWIPVIDDGFVGDHFQIDQTDGIVTWRHELQAGATIPDADRALVQQISDMIVFDFVLDDIDRFSGNNAKVSEDGKVLYFMDNTFSLTDNRRGHKKSHTYLERVHTFSRRLITRLRTLTRDEIEATLAADHPPFPELLHPRELDALMARRDLLLAYVDELIAAHGEAKVLAFP